MKGVFTELWRGKDLYRIFMNTQCTNYAIRGKVVDIGSSLNRASYYRFLQTTPGVEVECLDLGFEGPASQKHIDLEKDLLPHADKTVDTVLLFNVLEHLYNFSLVLAESKRVLKSKGELIGAVPFLVAYHPDPHDYWRYTAETLEKILTAQGFGTVEIVPFGYGPFSAGFAQIEGILPRILKILLVPLVFGMDRIITNWRPGLNEKKFSLGLFFRAVN